MQAPGGEGQYLAARGCDFTQKTEMFEIMTSAVELYRVGVYLTSTITPATHLADTSNLLSGAIITTHFLSARHPLLLNFNERISRQSETHRLQLSAKRNFTAKE